MIIHTPSDSAYSRSTVEPEAIYYEVCGCDCDLHCLQRDRPSPRMVTYSPDSYSPSESRRREPLTRRSSGAISGASLSPRSVQSNVSDHPDGCQVLFYNPLIYPVRYNRRPPSRTDNMALSIY